MEFIQNTLSSLVNGINDIWQFVSNIFGQIYQILRFIPHLVSVVFTAIGTMPTFMQVFAIITITILVLYLVLGRDNGSG